MDLTKLWLIGVGCLGFLASCDKVLDYSPDPPKPPKEESAYPVDRMITDKKGRNIDVKITGKGPDSITFLRKSDGKRFEYLIENLSVKDKAFVEGLPRNLKEKMVRPTPPYLASREKELTELNEQVERLKAKIQRASTEFRERTLKSELNRIIPRVEQLTDQIEAYKRQNPEP